MTDTQQPPYIMRSDGSIHQGKSVPPRAQTVANIAGDDLSYIRVDHQFRLQLGQFEIALSCAFTLCAADGVRHYLDPDARATLGPAMALYPGTASAVSIDEEATLRLQFVDGALIEVPADAQFEAWQISGPDGFLIVCPPGGHALAIWDSIERT